ncbi:VWA domain-containing protein [Campylobacter sp. FMV-PI01]|uniref:VWA domain-containing protein n=1 Tax=Campylobacter portucalensis TaxID=2608384 RepID=A0A6L5WI57_9BACT|nr:VWA domain-containing protein [Campylobacter portucalensis]MSN96948.1 VWA domain-containing protein [Campylobacter portucalensis]
MLEFENYLAFLIPLFYIFALKFFKQKRQSLYFSNVKMLKKATKKDNLVLEIFKFLSILFLSIALASPVKINESLHSKTKGYEIALMLDMSGSMKSFNRFAIIKEILNDFIDKRKNDSIGLSVYGDFAYIAVPLTYDKNSLKRLIDTLKIGMAGNKTALYEGLFLTTNLFKDSTAKNKIIILPTDGENTIDSVPFDVALNSAKKEGIKVYTIGIGLPGGYDSRALQIIAQETGGKYFNSNTKSELQEIYNEIDSLEKSEIQSQKYVKKIYYFEYFLAFGLIFLILVFFMQNKRFLR